MLLSKVANQLDNNYELYHYGIKGMKWGVRRKSSTDVTGVSKRKLKKKISKINQDPSSNKNTIRVQSKLKRDLDKTEVGQKVKNFNKNVGELQKVANSRGQQLQFNKATIDEIEKVRKQYSNTARKLYENKYRDEFAGAALKDLGYDDTRAGRDYIKRKGLI